MKKNPAICDIHICTSKTSLVKYFIKTCDIFSYNTSFTTKCKQNK